MELVMRAKHSSGEVVLLFALCVAASLVAVPGAQSGRSNAGDVPRLPYKLVDWPTRLTSAAGAPADWNFIQVASVAVTPRGTILVLHRGAHPLIEFDSTGTFVRSWGDGVFSEGKV